MWRREDEPLVYWTIVSFGAMASVGLLIIGFARSRQLSTHCRHKNGLTIRYGTEPSVVKRRIAPQLPPAERG
jgi:hypothetical protein